MLCPLGVFIVNYLRTSIISKSVETSAKRFDSHMLHLSEPCDSFYEHACGYYMNKEFIPPHLDYIDTIYERRREINKKIHHFFENKKDELETKPGFQKIRSFYESCMEETILPIPFYEQMKDELKYVGLTLKPPFSSTPPPSMSATKILAMLHTTSVGEPGFLFEVYVKDKNDGRILQFAESKNSLLYETQQIPDLKEALAEYIYNVSTILARIAGQPLKPADTEVEQRIREVAGFLTELIKIQEQPNKKDEDNIPMTISTLQIWTTKTLNGGEIQIKWTEFLEILYQDKRINSLIESNKNIILVKNKMQFEKILQLIRNTKTDVFIAAMWWFKVQSLVEFGPELLQSSYQIFENYAYRLSSPPRSTRCFNWIWIHFGLFVNHLLATEPQSIRIRDRASTMTENIIQTLAVSFHEASWVDDKTIQRAFSKLDKMQTFVGFTDSVTDSNFVDRTYDKIHISESCFIQTLSKLFRAKKRNNFFKIFSNSRNVFDENKVKIGVFYHEHSNTLEVPMAVLGSPFYDLGLKALDYGSLGVHIAHVLWHALDLKGRMFNEIGDPEYWWTASTTENFVKFVHRFQVINNDLIKPLNACIDGERTVLENMADWTGFKISLRAYRKSFSNGEKEIKLPWFNHYSPKKLFILAFANTFCIKANPSFLANQIQNESTPPNMARVNAVVKNSPLFANLWGCKHTHRMNPQQKYDFWK